MDLEGSGHDLSGTIPAFAWRDLSVRIAGILIDIQTRYQ
jgi:hypothetical protein